MVFDDIANGTDSPWTANDCPFSITVSAKKINGWELERTNTVYYVDNLYEVPWKRKYLKGDFAFTPRIPDEKFILDNASEETKQIKLVPMGATRLRLTLFPKYSKQQTTHLNNEMRCCISYRSKNSIDIKIVFLLFCKYLFSVFYRKQPRNRL